MLRDVRMLAFARTFSGKEPAPGKTAADRPSLAPPPLGWTIRGGAKAVA